MKEMENKNIVLKSLFSGIDGFALAFKKAGFNIDHYFSEVDKHAIAITKHNFKDAKELGSVTDMADAPKSDIITFGSPCQDFSLAGKRQGLGGKRSSLIQYAIDLIDRDRPDFFIWENVKGVYSANEGRDFQAVLQAFTNLGGYRLEWQLLNTKWFLPQNRERIYLVGHLAKPERSFKQIFPIKKNVRRVNEGAIKTKNVGALSAGGNSGGMHSQMTLIRHRSTSDFKQEEEVPTLRNGDKGEVRIVVKSATTKGYEEATKGDSVNLSQPDSKTRRGRVGKGVAQTLETSCNQGVIIPYSMGSSKPGRSCINSSRVPEIGDSKSSIRRLTPVECERLQGFPDNWTKYGNYNGVKKNVSDTQRYKCCGNAVTVDVVLEIAHRIKLQL